VCPKYKFFDMQDLHLMNSALYSLLSLEAMFLFKFVSDFKLSVQFILGKSYKSVYVLLCVPKIETN
jgi:hypothetical protein